MINSSKTAQNILIRGSESVCCFGILKCVLGTLSCDGQAGPTILEPGPRDTEVELESNK